MQVLVMSLVLCFYFVNFSTKNNMCMCLNFAAVVRKITFKFIKKNVYFTIVALYAIVGVVNAFMHRVSFYKKHELR